jgi:hypothetical protein
MFIILLLIGNNYFPSNIYIHKYTSIKRSLTYCILITRAKKLWENNRQNMYENMHEYT